MCGLAGGEVGQGLVQWALQVIGHRGPDGRGIETVGPLTLGHVRLSIQDLTEASAQPWNLATPFGTRVVTFNGEVWRPERVRAALGGAWSTSGDTEVVARLLGDPERSLPELPGMFALAWTDEAGVLYLTRDRFGEVPLHYGWTADGRLVYASEIRGVLALGAVPSTVQWVDPGYLGKYVPGSREITWTRWAPTLGLDRSPDGPITAAPVVLNRLRTGVLDRLTSDVPVAMLLSGGLDSAAVVALAVASGWQGPAYIAVHDPESVDLKHARRVAADLGVTLNEIRVEAPTEADLMAAVQACEMPHKAQVEITLGCLALAKALRSDGMRVVLSGEGSDELWASYGGIDYHGVQKFGWYEHRRRSFTGQHRKNFARTNKVFMAHGVEARLPFLDPGLVDYALSLSQHTVTDGGKHLKAVLAKAVTDDGLLREETAWRAKVAFQKGSKLDEAAARVDTGVKPITYYRRAFEFAFQGVNP